MFGTRLPSPRFRWPIAFALAGVLIVIVGLPHVMDTATAATADERNLVTGDTAALTGGTGTWQGTNAKSLKTHVWPAGNGSLVVQARLPGVVELQTGSGTLGTLATTAGGVYSGDFTVRAGDGGAQVGASLRWYDRAGSEFVRQRVTGAAVRDTNDRWLRATVTGLAPAGAAFVALTATLPATVLGETHYLSVPRLTVTPGGSARLAGPLHTSGNKIYDVNNAQVTLRGMNRAGLATTARPGNLTQHDIARIKAWGGNVVRLPLGQQIWLSGCESYDASYRAVVDQAVKWITDLGMLAVIDLHFNAPTCATAGLNPMPDARSKMFWKQVATRYANRPLVAFDLFNEPHSVSAATWADGGPTRTASGVAYQAVGMRSLYSTVRATGARNLVFIGGLGYASTWPSTAPLASTRNVVYAVHAYNCATPQDCVHGTSIDYMLDRFVAPGRYNPIMVTEFGWPTATSLDAPAFNRNVMSYAAARGWGWLAWAWDVDGTCSTKQYFDLLADGNCAAGDAYQPAPAGMPILQGMTKNR